MHQQEGIPPPDQIGVGVVLAVRDDLPALDPERGIDLRLIRAKQQPAEAERGGDGQR